jgi:cell division protein FtsW
MRSLEIALGLSVLALLTFGFVMLSSISSAATQHPDPFYYAKRQAMWLAIGLALCAVTACIDYHRYRHWIWPMFILAIILLAGVLVFGRRINGALRWFIIGPFRFQPSEFAKYVLVIVLACWLERMQRAGKGSLKPRIKQWTWGIFAPLAITGVMAVLILKEPDLGTTLLLGTVAVVMMWVAGASAGWLTAIVTTGGAGVAATIVAIFRYGMFHEHYQVQRLIHWWLEDDLKGSNYQQHIASLALGAGGPWGVGLGNSRMKMGFLPEAHTDFILPIIGEELGLVGALAVVVVFCVFVLCGLLLSRRSSDLFGLLLGTGIISIIGLQAIINIAVVTNTVPNKGMPLPFISYGGSSLVMMLAALGIVLNVIWQAHARAVGPSEPVEQEMQTVDT